MANLTDLDPHDGVQIFPSAASLSADGRFWRVNVNGLVYRDGRPTLGKRFMLGLLRRAMKVSKESLESELFRARIRGFMAEAEKGKRIAVRLADKVFTLRKGSKRSGMFHEELFVPVEQLPAGLGESSGEAGSLPLHLIDADGAEHSSSGRIFFLPRHGLSIVSDIDDTLKHTGVHCRRSMLTNTFLCDFEPIVGMQELYRRWAEQGAAFHYVSSSPWQLFAPLSDYLDTHGFPEGSYHLRAFRLRDHMLRRIFLGRKPVKGAYIRSLLKQFPQRRFVLVGDSGEFDPEIYGAVARRYPRQVASILIRRIPGQQLRDSRWERAFRNIPQGLWKLFDEPAELNAVLSDSGDAVLR